MIGFSCRPIRGVSGHMCMHFRIVKKNWKSRYFQPIAYMCGKGVKVEPQTAVLETLVWLEFESFYNISIISRLILCGVSIDDDTKTVHGCNVIVTSSCSILWSWGLESRNWSSARSHLKWIEFEKSNFIFPYPLPRNSTPLWRNAGFPKFQTIYDVQKFLVYF